MVQEARANCQKKLYAARKSARTDEKTAANDGAVHWIATRPSNDRITTERVSQSNSLGPAGTSVRRALVECLQQSATFVNAASFVRANRPRRIALWEPRNFMIVNDRDARVLIPDGTSD